MFYHCPRRDCNRPRKNRNILSIDSSDSSLQDNVPLNRSSEMIKNIYILPNINTVKGKLVTVVIGPRSVSCYTHSLVQYDTSICSGHLFTSIHAITLY